MQSKRAEKQRTLARRAQREIKEQSILWAVRRIGESQADYEARLHGPLSSYAQRRAPRGG
jgi:hypothetical protein